MTPDLAHKLRDPLKFAKFLWPNVTFYDKQREVIYSVQDNDETFVPAGNMLGKDFVTAFIALWFFLTRSPCRVITTSVDEMQLSSVLWGEMRRFIQTSRFPLDSTKGGPLLINHLHIRKFINPPTPKGQVCGISYIRGKVSAKGEGMLGHHAPDLGDGIPRTLLLIDEGSGVEDVVYEMGTTWARRLLCIGNPYPPGPGNSFFMKGVKGGDILAKE